MQRERLYPSYPTCASAASACGSQNTMSIAPYNAMAAAREARACSRRLIETVAAYTAPPLDAIPCGSETAAKQEVNKEGAMSCVRGGHPGYAAQRLAWTTIRDYDPKILVITPCSSGLEVITASLLRKPVREDNFGRSLAWGSSAYRNATALVPQCRRERPPRRSPARAWRRGTGARCGSMRVAPGGFPGHRGRAAGATPAD
jgi:hypothetical protein